MKTEAYSSQNCFYKIHLYTKSYLLFIENKWGSSKQGNFSPSLLDPDYLLSTESCICVLKDHNLVLILLWRVPNHYETISSPLVDTLPILSTFQTHFPHVSRCLRAGHVYDRCRNPAGHVWKTPSVYFNFWVVSLSTSPHHVFCFFSASFRIFSCFFRKYFLNVAFCPRIS